MTISQAEFEFIRKLVKDQAAIVLDHGKEYLVETRLFPVAQRAGMESISDLIKDVQDRRNGSLVTKVVEAMTTNETSFFRDFHPFETLRKTIIPELIKKREPTHEISIWCAACSSGQEPYTIGMLIRENFPQLSSWRIRIVCSDISEEMLDRTRQGIYSQLEVNRGLPIPMLVKYFTQNGTRWEVKDDLKRMLELRTINLAGNWPPFGLFDMVFIRNVLIYFDIETKREILGKIRKVLRDDAYMFLGSTETTINLDDHFEIIHYDKTSCYRKKQG